MPDRNIRHVVAEDLVALGCRSEGPPALRTGRARSDLRGVRLSLSPGIQTDSHRTAGQFQQAGKWAQTAVRNIKYYADGPWAVTVNIGGFLFFIGRRDRRSASFILKVRISSSGYLRSLSRCRVRLRGLRTQGLAAPRTHSEIRSIIAPGS